MSIRTAVPAAGEPAVPVARRQRPAQRRRDGSASCGRRPGSRHSRHAASRPSPHRRPAAARLPPRHGCRHPHPERSGCTPQAQVSSRGLAPDTAQPTAHAACRCWPAFPRERPGRSCRLPTAALPLAYAPAGTPFASRSTSASSAACSDVPTENVRLCLQRAGVHVQHHLVAVAGPSRGPVRRPARSRPPRQSRPPAAAHTTAPAAPPLPPRRPPPSSGQPLPPRPAAPAPYRTPPPAPAAARRLPPASAVPAPLPCRPRPPRSAASGGPAGAAPRSARPRGPPAASP